MRHSLILHLSEDRGALVEKEEDRLKFLFFDPEDLKGPWMLQVSNPLTSLEPPHWTGELLGPTHRVRFDLRVVLTHPLSFHQWQMGSVRVEGVLEVDGEVFSFPKTTHLLHITSPLPGPYAAAFVHRFERNRPGQFASLIFPRRGLWGMRYRAYLSWHTPDFHLQEAEGRHHFRPFRWRYVVQDADAYVYDVEVWAPQRYVMEMKTPEGYRYVCVIAHGFFSRLLGETPTHRYYARHTVFLDVHTPRRVHIDTHEHLAFPG